MSETMRLNRFLARAGVASRRGAEEVIAAGRVTVNGERAETPGAQVDVARDEVRVDGERVRVAAEHVTYAMNKPPGVTVTRGDRHAKRTVYELLPGGAPESVVPVGRLDVPSSGLLLLTTDGELAFRLTHPRYGVEKEYLAFGAVEPPAGALKKLEAGVELEDGSARAVRAEGVSVAEAAKAGLKVGAAGARIVMHQGKKRIVRRMCEAVGWPLKVLHRSRVGPVELGGLRRGQVRELRPAEVKALKKAAGLEG